MNEVDEDGEEDVQGGPEVEDEDATEEDLIPDLSGVHIEVVDSTHEGTKWLIVNGAYLIIVTGTTGGARVKIFCQV